MEDPIAQPTAVVVGARGVIGSTLTDHLLRADWRVIGLSRRGGTDAPGLHHLAVDLTDPGASRAIAPELASTTHVFYAAYQDRPTWAELVEPNVAMLANVLDAVADAPTLEHVSLMQGYKVYGAHLGPFKTPAREDDPPHMPPEFNVDQQQLLERSHERHDWTWSAIRPSIVGGTALGNPMNLAMVIGVYASIGRELGIPLRFPGEPGAYNSLLEMTDAGLLAAATVWAATEPRAANQAFNIANGDLFRWSDMWPRIAAMLNVDTAPSLPMSLTDTMADKGPVWENMRERHGLTPTYDQVSSWRFGDFVFAWNYDVFADTSKARRLGFHHYVDTTEMFDRLIAELRAGHVIP
jgi:nucleoside-diphosphate-sugar epimerase